MIYFILSGKVIPLLLFVSFVRAFLPAAVPTEGSLSSRGLSSVTMHRILQISPQTASKDPTWCLPLLFPVQSFLCLVRIQWMVQLFIRQLPPRGAKFSMLHSVTSCLLTILEFLRTTANKKWPSSLQCLPSDRTDGESSTNSTQVSAKLQDMLTFACVSETTMPVAVWISLLLKQDNPITCDAAPLSTIHILPLDVSQSRLRYSSPSWRRDVCRSLCCGHHFCVLLS